MSFRWCRLRLRAALVFALACSGTGFIRTFVEFLQQKERSSSMAAQTAEKGGLSGKTWRQPPSVFCNDGQRARAEYWQAQSAQVCDARQGLASLENWSRGWAAGYSAIYGDPPYRDSLLSTLDGVLSWDAAYCKRAGLVETRSNRTKNLEILGNLSAILERSERICGTEAIQSTLRDTPPAELQAAQAAISARQAAMKRLPAFLRRPFMEETLYLRQVASQCQSGFFPCMVHYCLYTFCKMPDGRVGMGCQCGKDWDVSSIPATGTAAA